MRDSPARSWAPTPFFLLLEWLGGSLLVSSRETLILTLLERKNEVRTQGLGSGPTAAKRDFRFGIPIPVCGSENMYLSRGVPTWLPYLYPGHSARQAQDCHHQPGQGELRVMVGSPGV